MLRDKIDGLEYPRYRGCGGGTSLERKVAMDEDTNSMNSELVICPDCNCQVSPHRLEDHRLHRCLKHKVKLNRVRRPKRLF